MIIELILNGFVQGSLLALICIGYSLAYGSAKVLNFAHADVLVAGGGYLVLLLMAGAKSPNIAPIGMAIIFGISCFIVTWPYKKYQYKSIWKNRGISAFISFLIIVIIYFSVSRLPFILSAIIAIPLTALLATAVYRLGYLPLIRSNAPRTSILLAALGMSIAIESILLIIWGSERRVFPANILPSLFVVRASAENISFWDSITKYGVFPITFDIVLPIYDILIILIFIIISAALISFFKYSRIADAIIASADSPIASRSCGIPVDRMLGYAFFLGGAIASIGGTLYILRAKSLDPTAGFSLGIIAFVACVLGGIGSLRGSIAGAFLVSMVTSLAPAISLNEWAEKYLPSNWLDWMPSLRLGDWSYGVLYALMIITIIFKPRGLFSK